MYTEYFRLKENPFSIAPDPAYFFVSDQHREALAHLMYCFSSDGGFVLLTGEVGTGKTTVCRRLLEHAPADCNIAFVLYPKLTGEELLAAICDDFAIPSPGEGATARVLVSKIYDYLVKTHESGLKAILIIEEAQNLSDEVLEQIRLLTNLETNKQKLLRIVMLGQPELREKLTRPALRQLSQRITAQYHLAPLSVSDLEAYVNHRLRVAGANQGGLFSPSALKELYRLTKGVPRLINVICDRALTGAYIESKNRVDKRILRAAAREVSVRSPVASRFRLVHVVLICFIGMIVVAGAYYGWKFVNGRNGDLADTAVKAPASGERSVADVPDSLSQKEIPITISLEGLVVPSGEDGRPGRSGAFQAVLRKWNVEVEAKPYEDICNRVGTQGLACLKGKENLDGLRRLNRPAILRMRDKRGVAYYAALTHLSGDRASLMIGETAQTVDVKEIGRKWPGDYELLWRPPPGYSRWIGPGDKGAMVSWLGRQLAVAEGRPVSSEDEPVYSHAMADRLRQFQVGAALVPDGMVGPKTAIRLSDVTPNSDPRLQSGQGGR